MNRAAQSDTGPLQQLMIVVILVAAATTGWLMFFTGVTDGYNLSLADESAFSIFNESFKNVSITANELNTALTATTPPSAGEIILTMLTGGFASLVALLFAIPSFLVVIIAEGFSILGLGAFTAYANILVLVIVIFAVLAIIMKVRA